MEQDTGQNREQDVHSDESTAPDHKPVLLKEIVDWLKADQGGVFVDCTMGLGGHAEAILTASSTARVIGIDRDTEAIEAARKRLRNYAARVSFNHDNFKDLGEVLIRQPAEWLAGGVKGILADLGVSSLQLDRAERGFSFQKDAPLDMRMDVTSGRTAADLIEQLTERELADLIFEYGEEHGARRIARLIARVRQEEPIQTTRQLADLVVRALNLKGRWRVHPATKTFQALRIAVNEELTGLAEFISDAVGALQPGGRLAIISFHSLEDRIVKRSFQKEAGNCICPPEIPVCICNWEMSKRVEILTRRPIVPGEAEIESNARARSAKLRVCARL